MSLLAVIPARKGSKRLPGKNMKLFCHKPLIYWTIKVAMASKEFDNIVVSTDDPKVRKYCKKFPVIIRNRPKELATDTADIWDVVRDVVNWLEKKEIYHLDVMLLQPTSPLRTVVDIDNVLENNKSTVSVANHQEEGKYIVYKKNGAIYYVDVDTLLLSKAPIEFESVYLMPPERSIDIDTEEDFKNAEDIFSQLQ